ncbi:MAG: hypothetical protein H6Q68_2748 [Firmicutes bacterium]|nr:hypothetical protein [Bacillota bacterium]
MKAMVENGGMSNLWFFRRDCAYGREVAIYDTKCLFMIYF